MTKLQRTDSDWKTAVAHGASVVFWLAAWQVASWAMAQPLILPGPLEVVLALGDAVVRASFWTSIGFSAARIAGALVVTYVLALPAAFLAHRIRAIRMLLAPPLQAIKATPVVCVVVLLLLWLGSANVSFAAVLLMALPGLYFTTLEGLAHQDVRMTELFDVHGVCGVRRALALTWQQVLPYVRAASANVVGMAWKAGVAAELIGVPIGSIGERIYQSKLLIETADVLAWTVVVIVLSAACERVILALLRASGPASARLAIRLRRTPDTWRTSDARCTSDASGTSEAGQAVSFVTPGAIELRDVRPSYEGFDHEINLSVAGGARVCLTGPSGQGKTTTLRIVAGLLRPAAGTHYIPARRAMLFQESRLIEDASALQNILLFAAPEVDEAATRAALHALLPDVDVRVPVRALSGGQRRRVELIRTLFIPSDAVLLDEPFTGLDAAAREVAAAFVLEHLQGRTLLIATHDPRDLALQS